VFVVRLPLNPKHPDRICWGCDTFCPEDDMRCGNGTIRCPHPIEIFGESWKDEDSAPATSPWSQVVGAPAPSL